MQGQRDRFADIHCDIHCRAALEDESRVSVSVLAIGPEHMPPGLEWLEPQITVSVDLPHGWRIETAERIGTTSGGPSALDSTDGGTVSLGYLCPGQMALLRFVFEVEPSEGPLVVTVSNNVEEPHPGHPHRLTARFVVKVLPTPAGNLLIGLSSPAYEVAVAPDTAACVDLDHGCSGLTIGIDLQPGIAGCGHTVCLGDELNQLPE